MTLLKLNAFTGRFLRFVFVGTNREEVFEVAVDILKAWENYENKDLEIFRESNGEPHNAITPIVRRQGDAYEFDLVLRNNRTTEEFPDGIFHPHADVQHIKKRKYRFN